MTCEDEGCPHYGTPHSHPDDQSDWPPEDLVDIAYEALTDELEYWRIIGPDAKGVYIAVRDPQIEMKMKAAAIIMPQTSADEIAAENSVRKSFRLKDKTHAVACLQWHALQAALVAVRGELSPSLSNTVATTTGDENLNQATNDEEDEDK